MTATSDNRDLTDHIFGELPEEAEAGLQARIEDEPSVADELSELRAFSTKLHDALKSEVLCGPDLGAAKRQVILNAARSIAGKRRQGGDPWVFGLCVAAAAAMLIAAFLPLPLRPEAVPHDNRMVARPVARQPGPLVLDSPQPDVLQEDRIIATADDVPRIASLPQIDAQTDALDIVETILNPRHETIRIDTLYLKYSRSASAAPPAHARLFNTSFASFLDMPYFSVVSRPFMAIPLRHESSALQVLRSSVGEGRLPEPRTVTTHELVNAPDYAYPQPDQSELFRIGTDLHYCPWNEAALLARVWVSGSHQSRTTLLAEWAGATIEFNPAYIAAYRFLGATPGQIASGNAPVLPHRIALHRGCRITLLFELIPQGVTLDPAHLLRTADKPVFEALDNSTADPANAFNFALTYRPADGGETVLMSMEQEADVLPFVSADPSFKLAAAAALLSGLIDQRVHPNVRLWNKTIELATAAAQNDQSAGATEFLDLARHARSLMLKFGDTAAPPGK